MLDVCVDSKHADALSEAVLLGVGLKISDFGTAARLDTLQACSYGTAAADATTMFSTQIGTPAWMAPEVLQQSK